MTPANPTTPILGDPLGDDPERTMTLAERLAPAAEHAYSAFLVNRSWILRSDSNAIHSEIVGNHAEIEARRLEGAAQDLAKRGVAELLGELADGGFAWSDIARLVGVSVPAIRKWRTGKAASGDNVLLLAGLVALARWLRDDHHVDDVASWLEVPLTMGAPTTRMDLLRAGHRDLLIRSLVGDGLTVEAVLDEYEPGWRPHHDRDFEVFAAGDGQRSIRAKQT